MLLIPNMNFVSELCRNVNCEHIGIKIENMYFSMFWPNKAIITEFSFHFINTHFVSINSKLHFLQDK